MDTTKRIENHRKAKELKSEGYTVTSPEQKRARKEWIESLEHRTWSWQNTVNQIATKVSLNDIQKGSMLVMSTFLELNGEGKLFDTEGGKLTINKLSKLLGKSTRTAKRIIDECENIGALTTHKEGKETVITFTDMLYTCGKLEGEQTQHVKVFKVAVRNLIKVLTLKEVGFLSDLLPHFHHKSHILCNNPTWNGSDGMQVWRRKDIIEVLEYDKDFVRKAVNKFIRNGILLELKSRIDVIYLSPEIACRQASGVTLEEIEKVALQYVGDGDNIQYR